MLKFELTRSAFCCGVHADSLCLQHVANSYKTIIITKMPNYNQLDTRTQPASMSTLTHGKQPL